jgi:hypothetical protein
VCLVLSHNPPFSVSHQSREEIDCQQDECHEMSMCATHNNGTTIHSTISTKKEEWLKVNSKRRRTSRWVTRQKKKKNEYHQIVSLSLSLNRWNVIYRKSLTQMYKLEVGWNSFDWRVPTITININHQMRFFILNNTKNEAIKAPLSMYSNRSCRSIF